MSGKRKQNEDVDRSGRGYGGRDVMISAGSKYKRGRLFSTRLCLFILTLF